MITMVLFAGVAGATTVLRMDLKQLTLASEMIMEGEVTKVEAKFEKGNSTIATYVEIKPKAFIKGSDERITIRVPGGQVGDKGLKVFGAPNFSAGQKVFLFLQKNPFDKDNYSVSGFYQGRYMIFDSDGSKHAVADNGIGSKIFESCSKNKLECVQRKGLKVLKYSEFIEKVKSYLASPEMVEF